MALKISTLELDYHHLITQVLVISGLPIETCQSVYWKLWHLSSLIHYYIKKLFTDFLTFLRTYIFYLPDVNEFVISFMEQLLCFSISSITLMIQNPGCLGGGKWALSFERNETTSSIVGLSLAWSCVHRRSIRMYRITLVGEYDPSKVVSISFKASPSLLNFHA